MVIAVRTSSARQKASKESDLARYPEARKRGREAFSWLGWIASTVMPHSSTRSTRTPSGARWPPALRPYPLTFGTAWRYLSSWAKRPSMAIMRPLASMTQRACSSLAQSIPALVECSSIPKPPPPLLLRSVATRLRRRWSGCGFTEDEVPLRVLIGRRSAELWRDALLPLRVPGRCREALHSDKGPPLDEASICGALPVSFRPRYEHELTL